MPVNHTILGRSIEILLVEDNYSDIILVKEALKEGHINIELNSVQDGNEALEYLYKRGKYSKVSSPDIVLLDINLPKLNGIEVLKNIKSDESLREIPVIILSTSKSRDDIKTAYKNYANSYIVKPIDFDKFIEVVKTIETFWLTITELPK